MNKAEFIKNYHVWFSAEKEAESQWKIDLDSLIEQACKEQRERCARQVLYDHQLDALNNIVQAKGSVFNAPLANE